jgi:glutathione S-transferase
MLTLVIGNQNLSSWSLRPWLVLRHFDFEFRTVKLMLDTPAFHAEIARYSAARRVPVLIDDELHVWDSLAIAEYLNEKVEGRAWPADPARRAHARSISAEMHSGFPTLREHWSMRAVGTNPGVRLPPAGLADVARVEQIWSECRARHSAQGPWLFGDYSIADAMYAPVVLRFRHYGATPSAPAAAAYMEHVLQDRHLRDWIREAEQEVAA